MKTLVAELVRHYTENDGFLLVHDRRLFGGIYRLDCPDFFKEYELGLLSDYADTTGIPYLTTGSVGETIETGICFRRGSKNSIAARSPHYPRRKYEYEYIYAQRLGRYIAREMMRRKQNIIHFKVNADNPYPHYFGSSCPMGKCFRSEFKTTWANEMIGHIPWKNTSSDSLDWSRHERLRVQIFRSRCRLTFLNTEGLNWKTLESISNLLHAARDVDQIEELISQQQKPATA